MLALAIRVFKTEENEKSVYLLLNLNLKRL